MTTEDILIKVVLPIVAALLGGGAVAAVLQYKLNRPKTNAEAQKVAADVIVTFADGWKSYAEKLERRIMDLEKRNERADERYDIMVAEKDKQIAELKSRILVLEKQVESMPIPV